LIESEGINGDGDASVPKRKLFVVGCARSGTSWVNSILGYHPQVVRGPESHLFPVLYGHLIVADARIRRMRVLGAYDRSAERRLGPGAVTAGPHRWIERDALERLLTRAESEAQPGEETARYVIGAILDDFFARTRGESGRILVEKTPRHLMYADHILRWWPDAVIVEVLRDGRDVCVSLAHKSTVAEWAPAERSDQIERWVQAVDRGATLRPTPLAKGRWTLVRYEDLWDNPVREVRRLYEFVGIPFDEQRIPEVVEATSLSRSRRPGNRHHVREGGVGGWRREFSDADRELFDRLAGDLLTAHGYERT
jgi:hypothetical protein